jgi:hypothetical protein
MAVMEESDLNISNVGKSKGLWCGLGVLVSAIMLHVVPVYAAPRGPPAGSKLHLTHVETVQQTTVTGEAFGPVGPGCAANTGGPSCTL